MQVGPHLLTSQGNDTVNKQNASSRKLINMKQFKCKKNNHVQTKHFIIWFGGLIYIPTHSVPKLLIKLSKFDLNKHNSKACSFIYFVCSFSSAMSLFTLDSLQILKSIWAPSFFQENFLPRGNFFVLVDNMHVSAEKVSKMKELANILQVLLLQRVFHKNVLTVLYIYVL